jgi:hypothetical protein
VAVAVALTVTVLGLAFVTIIRCPATPYAW